MTKIFTAKTVEEAMALAAKDFGRSISEIKFKVLDEGKRGFLGIGKSDAKVEATYNIPSAVPVDQPKKTEAPIEKKAETAVKSETKPAEPKKEEVKPAAAPAVKDEVKKEVREEEKPGNDDIKSAEKTEDEADYSLDNFTLIEDESLIDPKVKLAIDYTDSILRAMGVEAEFTVYQNETGAVVNVNSDNNGTIIGRRGETLDAIQYLCSIIANKGDKDYFRITIDCLGYRGKRKETLEALAAKVAKSVLRTGRSQPLEPMNPYERRVIHSAISKIEGVSSRSVGEEPYRKIIISSNNPSRGGGRRRDDRRGGGRRNDRRNDRSRNREQNFERKSVDLSTSFEKDYKKPKPEDSLDAGLYGKIEL